MKENEYLRLKQKIEDEAREKLRALEIVWKMSNAQAAPAASKTSLKSGVMASVREAVQSFSGEFTLRDLESWIKKNKPEIRVSRPQALSTAIKRLRTKKEIEIVSNRDGSVPARYKRISGVAIDPLDPLGENVKEIEEVPF